MISRNIDLTEHRDFSSSGHIMLAHSFFDVMDQDVMSMDDYEVILKHERIFGKTRHTNERLDVFRKSDAVFMQECSRFCERCGKEFRIPWRIRGGLCERCDDILENEAGKVPWKNEKRYAQVSHERQRNASEVFQLR